MDELLCLIGGLTVGFKGDAGLVWWSGRAEKGEVEVGIQGCS